jgi:hypothetical protein
VCEGGRERRNEYRPQLIRLAKMRRRRGECEEGENKSLAWSGFFSQSF